MITIFYSTREIYQMSRVIDDPLYTYELEICPMSSGPHKGSLMELRIEDISNDGYDSYLYIGPITKEQLVLLGQAIIDMARLD